MKREIIKPFREVENCLKVMTVPKAPLKIIPNAKHNSINKDSWSLCDADGVCLFTLTVGNEVMTTSAELAGMRYVIENSVHWLKGLVVLVDHMEEVIKALEDNLLQVNANLLRIETRVGESIDEMDKAMKNVKKCLDVEDELPSPPKQRIGYLEAVG